MTTTLPQGLITNTDSISADIKQVDEVTIEDIRRLWKAYSVNKHVLRYSSGIRLENLFWRIWGNRGRLCHVLTGSTVARLVNYMSEDHDMIRTTTVASPRAQRRRVEFSELSRRQEYSSSSFGDGEDDSEDQEEAEELAQLPPSSTRPPTTKDSRGSKLGRSEVSAGGDSVPEFSSAQSRPGTSTPPSGKPQDGSGRKRTASSGGNAPLTRSPTQATISEAPSKDDDEEEKDSDRIRMGEVEEDKEEFEPSPRRSQQILRPWFLWDEVREGKIHIKGSWPPYLHVHSSQRH
ncbi:MAG: hypothetical protein M1816_001174 [Peltula sp. TS41687]|nr:MAG: hypothetical protein M1816_001174 [Peltula sp. TS41687]